MVIGLVMREAGRRLVIGALTGTALSLAAARSVGALLFGLQPYDPVTLATAIALLTVIAALASFLPARRASQLDPMATLRIDRPWKFNCCPGQGAIELPRPRLHPGVFEVVVVES